MKRLITICLIVLLVVAVSGIEVFAQQGANPLITGRYLNNSTGKIFKYKAVKADTSSRLIFVIDTALHFFGKSVALKTKVSDNFYTLIIGTSADTVGELAKIMSDTIQNYTSAFRFKAKPVTTALADTLVLYGDTIRTWQTSFTYGGSKIDTLVFTTGFGYQSSNATWSKICSIRVASGNGDSAANVMTGSDSFMCYFNSPHAITLADTITPLFVGIVSSDSINPKSLGYVVTKGLYPAKVMGNTRNITPGDILYVHQKGNLGTSEVLANYTNGNFIPTVYADTIHFGTAQTRRAKYVPGCTWSTPVFVTPRRHTISATIDTVTYNAIGKTDSVVVHQVDTKTGSVPGVGIIDTVSVLAIISKKAAPILNYKAGVAMDYSKVDSSLILISIEK